MLFFASRMHLVDGNEIVAVVFLATGRTDDAVIVIINRLNVVQCIAVIVIPVAELVDGPGLDSRHDPRKRPASTGWTREHR
jgi:hypothetical protein